MIVANLIDDLVRGHQAGLWRYLRVLGCDGPTADDLAQETFLAMLRLPFEVRSRGETAAWLRAKARFLWLERVRKEARRRETALADATDEVWAEYAGGDDGESWRRALERCLERLPERSRTAIDLRYAERASREEMARRLSLKENGVKTLLQRVRASLRRCVEKAVRE